MKNHLKYCIIPLRSFVGIVGFFLLSACATLPSHQTADNQNVTWSQRKNQLTPLRHWQIQGVMSIRTTQQAVNASFYWEQLKRRYYLHLFGPLGVGSIQIHGNPQQITLIEPHRQTITSKNAEQLLQKELGWKLPISNLYYWIRGLPVPTQPANKYFDHRNHLATLQQGGWTINYLGYAGFHQIDLPTKVSLRYPGLSIRIVISQWQF